MSSRYERGRAAEYKAIKDLEAEGYRAVRTAGSHGEADVIAWNASDVRFIQVKTYIETKESYLKDITQLMELVTPPNTSRELWVRRHGARGWDDQIRIDTPED